MGRTSSRCPAMSHAASELQLRPSYLGGGLAEKSVADGVRVQPALVI